MIGKLLALPIKIINAPAWALENLLSVGSPVPEDARIISKPLDILAETLEEIDK